jgi:DNA-binding MarR family transcriptional regulator
MISGSETTLRQAPALAQELLDSSGFLLARLGVGFKARAIARIEAEGFEAHQYSVLAILAEGARVTQATIADALDLDPSRLVTLLDALEDRRLIARQRDVQDRRRHVVSITDGGRRELEHLRSIARELDDEFLAPLAPEDRDTFHELLVRLAEEHDPDCAFGPPLPPPA